MNHLSETLYPLYITQGKVPPGSFSSRADKPGIFVVSQSAGMNFQHFSCSTYSEQCLIFFHVAFPYYTSGAGLYSGTGSISNEYPLSISEKSYR